MANFDYSVLIGGAEKREIRIDPYDPSWPDQYEEHCRTIRRTLGQRLLAIHHIGSTSVPGLAAKPIIDILTIVADSSNENAYVPDLEAVGYVLRVREPAVHEHRMLRTPSRSAHVHVYSLGAPKSSVVEAIIARAISATSR